MRTVRIISARFVLLGCMAVGMLPLANDSARADMHQSSAYKPTVLITGSNRGIGFEFVRQLSARDWRIIATARTPENAADLKAMAATDPDILIETLDVTDDAEIAALKLKYQEQPIDILMLNAATGPTGIDRFTSLDMNRGPRYFEVNAIGPMKVAQAFYENVQASRMKQIYAMSSDSGSYVAGSQAPILWHYKASKAALNMYFHTLAFDAKRRGVTVIILHPGWVASNPQTAQLPGAIPTEDSVRQMLEVMDAITPEDNGRFISYLGETMPW